MKECTLETCNWLLSQFGGKSKIKWKTFEHNGVLFPPDYVTHDIPIIYNNKKIHLKKDEEELATLYAKYLDTDYVTNNTFNKNFMKGWLKVLDPAYGIISLNDCDFSLIFEHLLKIKEEKKLKKNELLNEKKEDKYKTAIIDGQIQKVGNYRIEPPGIFLGRGCNKNLGKIKRRIYPEDITINIGKDVKIPSVSDGRNWGEIIHDKTVEWLASWKDSINGKIKYVRLGNDSKFKEENDVNKFELARKLKKKIKKIRQNNNDNINNKDSKIRQIATSLYFIDKLALRVGNEKGDGSADTVGVSSLKVKHLKLLDNNKLKLDFLGKDSIRYTNTITVDEEIYKNIIEFLKDKNNDEEIFHLITPNDINKYLQSFMNKLTSKVFRTYNASYVFQKELLKIKNDTFDNLESSDKINKLLDLFNKANTKVALLCNHQKNVSKSFEKQLNNINNKINDLRGKLKNKKTNKKKIKEKIKNLKNKKNMKIEIKNISLGTSKTNYIDPRITIAFMKKFNIPINKILPNTLQNKFKWAMSVNSDFIF
jgi:DNA topoisomerase-1